MGCVPRFVKEVYMTGTQRLLLASSVCAVLGLGSLAGCESTQPGVTNTVGRYDMVIDAPPARVTQVVQGVLQDDYKFQIDTSAYTKIDGKVVAHTAQGTKVWVWVNRQGDNMSQV